MMVNIESEIFYFDPYVWLVRDAKLAQNWRCVVLQNYGLLRIFVEESVADDATIATK